MPKTCQLTWLVLTACAVAPTLGVAAQETAVAPAPRADNYYAAGNRIDITRPMEGDVVVAGRTIVIAQPVSGDILAAGWNVTVSADANDDVRVAAGTIRLDASVRGDLTAAGGDVTTGPQTHVAGRAWLTGDSVRVDGIYEKELRVAARSAQLGGEIRKPVFIVADELEVLPGARILAPITYKGVNEATIGTGATLSGPIAFERIERREARDARAWPAVSTFLFTVHLLVVGLLALYFVPTFEPSIVATLRAQPGWSLLAGFAMLVTAPAAAVVLMASVFGLPLGVALGMCYVMALFAGVLATAFFVGDLEARLLKAGPIATTGQHALMLLAGVLTLAVLRLLVGSVVVFVSMLFGLGALVLWLYHLHALGQPQAAHT